MTESRAFLFVKRLVVLSGDAVAYDQSFHLGLNIIRGANSSGKSTILDFIFYALGGEVLIWKTAASKCTTVIAEVEVNGATLTLQREIADEGKRPMAIYFGPFEESRQHRFKNWTQYPYSARGANESFSKVLFRALDFPEVKSDLDSNITMHQLLRLAYVDQISRTTSLMREEDFDSHLVRKTIAELLFGVYDDTLYSDELALKTRNRELEDVSLQIINATDVLEEVGEEIDAEKILELATKTKAALDQANSSIESVLAEAVPVRDTSQTETEHLRLQISKLKQKAADAAEQVESMNLEILDSDIFIQNLENRKKSLDESLATRDALGDLPHCPLCSVALKEVEGKAVCEMSGRSIPGDFGRSNMLKMREELRFQILESKTLQGKRTEKRNLAVAKRDEAKAEFEQLTRTYQQKVKSVKSARDNRLDELYQQKGKLESELEYCLRLKKYADVIVNLKKREFQLKGFVAELEASIKEKRQRQAGRWQEATLDIQEAARWIVSHDLPRQEEFLAVDSIKLDFGRNTYLLNDKNNFSASSNAVLKNAIHFGILYASTLKTFFRYPRFLLCDNVEDGGMEEDRSKNFQKIVAGMADEATQPFQVIFSTSMIDPSLDNEKYCIGPKYTKENKSLKLS